MMTPYKLMLALRQVGNVSDFVRRHKLARRTIWRLRKRGATPSKRTMDRVVDALTKEGILK